MLLELFNTIFPVVACAGLGYLWARFAQPYDTRIVTRLVGSIGAPCLIFSTMVGIEGMSGQIAEMALSAVTALLAFAAFVLLQLGIAATGNYGFFNLLTFALCASLLDDQAILRAANFLPRRARARLARAVGEDASPSGTFAISAQRLRSALAVGLLLLGVSRLSLEIVGVDPLAGIAPDALRQASRWHVVNSYGLFAVMTTERSEIVIEGSEDGVQWREYGFHWKPGDLGERPRFALLHMPRLDWQMRFAALSSPQRQRWFASFLRRVHEGSPAVLGLLAHDPFSGAPPRFLRARLYDYRFSDFAAWRESGEWWTREPGRLYLGPLERRWAPHRPIPPRP